MKINFLIYLSSLNLNSLEVIRGQDKDHLRKNMLLLKEEREIPPSSYILTKGIFSLQGINSYVIRIGTLTFIFWRLKTNYSDPNVKNLFSSDILPFFGTRIENMFQGMPQISNGVISSSCSYLFTGVVSILLGNSYTSQTVSFFYFGNFANKDQLIRIALISIGVETFCLSLQLLMTYVTWNMSIESGIMYFNMIKYVVALIMTLATVYFTGYSTQKNGEISYDLYNVFALFKIFFFMYILSEKLKGIKNTFNGGAINILNGGAENILQIFLKICEETYTEIQNNEQFIKRKSQFNLLILSILFYYTFAERLKQLPEVEHFKFLKKIKHDEKHQNFYIQNHNNNIGLTY